MADPKRRQEVMSLLTGRPSTSPTAKPAVTTETGGGLQPPAWWHGDDDAYHSSQIARSQARTR